MPNIVIIFLAGVFNGIGDFFVKLSAGKISPAVGGLVISLSSAIPLAIYYLMVEKPLGNAVVTKPGLFITGIGGIFIGLGVIFFFLLFSHGVNISTAQPVIKSIVVLTAVVLGILVLREKMTPAQAVGLVLSVAGIYFLTK